MKKILTALGLLVCFSGSAQIFQVGLRAGINVQGMSVSGFTADPNASLKEISSPGYQTGWHAGVYSRVKVLGFYVQPELLFRRFTASYEFTTDGGVEKADLAVNQLDIPLMVGYKLLWFRANLGPVYSQPISSTSNLGKGFNNGTWGYQAGIGFDFWKILLDLKYEGSFTSFGESITFNGVTYPLNSYPGGFVLSVGYKLF